jgi:hypothetical protein
MIRLTDTRHAQGRRAAMHELDLSKRRRPAAADALWKRLASNASSESNYRTFAADGRVLRLWRLLDDGSAHAVSLDLPPISSLSGCKAAPDVTVAALVADAKRDDAGCALAARVVGLLNDALDPYEKVRGAVSPWRINTFNYAVSADGAETIWWDALPHFRAVLSVRALALQLRL